MECTARCTGARMRSGDDSRGTLEIVERTAQFTRQLLRTGPSIDYWCAGDTENGLLESNRFVTDCGYRADRFRGEWEIQRRQYSTGAVNCVWAGGTTAGW